MPAKKKTKRTTKKKTPRKKKAVKKIAKKTVEDILNEGKDKEPAPIVTMEPTENDFQDPEGEPEAEDYNPYKPGWAQKYQEETQPVVKTTQPSTPATPVVKKEQTLDAVKVLENIIDAAEFMIKRLKPRSYQKVETPDLIKQRISLAKKLLNKLENEKE